MSSFYLVDRADAHTIDLVVVARAEFSGWMQLQTPAVKKWLQVNKLKPQGGQVCVVPKSKSEIEFVVAVVENPEDPFAYCDIPGQLPAARYRLIDKLSPAGADAMALGWGLACYRFHQYKRKPVNGLSELVWPSNASRDDVARYLSSIYWVRDLINTPAEDMGPDALEGQARELAKAYKAKISVITGDDLLKKNYPTIHTVGRAARKKPRLIDMVWGKASDPKITLVGKGVCFDTGGLNIKTGSSMKLMKKDMGGAAHVLGLARMIMDADLPIRLRVLVPAVENNIDGSAFRPSDVITTRKGMRVEIDNTDAEGRLVMCDALTEAVSEKPALVIDFATLTGAARVALGPELPALFCNDDAIASEIAEACHYTGDPLWRLPLYAPYRSMLDSYVADISNASSGGYAGAITAALFLQEFVEDTKWVHVDLMAWNVSAKPGRPVGGEAMGMRAMFDFLCERFS